MAKKKAQLFVRRVAGRPVAKEDASDKTPEDLNEPDVEADVESKAEEPNDEDRMCEECGDGPFKGPQGLAVHQAAKHGSDS